jgi:hypothetical protein
VMSGKWPSRLVSLVSLSILAACANPSVESGAGGGSWPSAVWYDSQGHRVPDGTDKGSRFALELAVRQGDKHCDWDTITFLEIAWPLGSVVHSGEGVRQRVRQYVRGPSSELRELPLRSSFDPSASLPENATDTGYQSSDDWQLWISSDDVDRHVYLLNGARVERWPRTAEFILCR